MSWLSKALRKVSDALLGTNLSKKDTGASILAQTLNTTATTMGDKTTTPVAGTSTTGSTVPQLAPDVAAARIDEIQQGQLTAGRRKTNLGANVLAAGLADQRSGAKMLLGG